MRRLILAELQKLTSTRLWWWLLIAAVAITALYVSLQIAFSDDPDTWTLPLRTLEGQRTLLSSAASAAAPLAAILGAIGITGEYRHRTATDTFLATPHRGRVLGAKLTVYGLAGAGFAIVCAAVAIAIAWPWLAADGLRLELTHPDNLATLAGVVTGVTLFGLLGVGLGALLRDQVGTVVGLLVFLFVVEPIVTGIGALASWTIYLPGPARAAVTGIVVTGRAFLDPLPGALVLVGYAAALAIAGTVVTTRRDVA